MVFPVFRLRVWDAKNHAECQHKGLSGQHLFKKVCYFYPAAVPTASFLNLNG